MRIRNAITESKANGYTIAAIAREHGLSEQSVLDHLASAAAGYTYHEDWIAETAPKPLEPDTGVLTLADAKDALGAHTGASERTCAVCGGIIQPTGRRGRPRTVHIECRRA